MKTEVKKFFEERFRKISGPRPRLTRLNLNKLSVEESLALEEEFSTEEIHEAVFNCEGDISPGPDSFNITFIKRCWGIIGKNIVKCVQYFHHKKSCLTLLRCLS